MTENEINFSKLMYSTLCDTYAMAQQLYYQETNQQKKEEYLRTLDNCYDVLMRIKANVDSLKVSSSTSSVPVNKSNSSQSEYKYYMMRINLPYSMRDIDYFLYCDGDSPYTSVSTSRIYIKDNYYYIYKDSCGIELFPIIAEKRGNRYIDIITGQEYLECPPPSKKGYTGRQGKYRDFDSVYTQGKLVATPVVGMPTTTVREDLEKLTHSQIKEYRDKMRIVTRIIVSNIENYCNEREEYYKSHANDDAYIRNFKNRQ